MHPNPKSISNLGTHQRKEEIEMKGLLQNVNVIGLLSWSHMSMRCVVKEGK